MGVAFTFLMSRQDIFFLNYCWGKHAEIRYNISWLDIAAEAMPFAESVESLSSSDIEQPSRKKQRTSTGSTGSGSKRESPAKEKLLSETYLRVLVSNGVPCCKQGCLSPFQAPSRFQELMTYRTCWAQTHKLDQDVIVSCFWIFWKIPTS